MDHIAFMMNVHTMSLRSPSLTSTIAPTLMGSLAVIMDSRTLMDRPSLMMDSLALMASFALMMISLALSLVSLALTDTHGDDHRQRRVVDVRPRADGQPRIHDERAGDVGGQRRVDRGRARDVVGQPRVVVGRLHDDSGQPRVDAHTRADDDGQPRVVGWRSRVDGQPLVGDGPTRVVETPLPATPQFGTQLIAAATKAQEWAAQAPVCLADKRAVLESVFQAARRKMSKHRRRRGAR